MCYFISRQLHTGKLNPRALKSREILKGPSSLSQGVFFRLQCHDIIRIKQVDEVRPSFGCIYAFV